jgi:putative ABC transport system permease protein
MPAPLPWIVRLYCGVSRRVLPRELWVEHGRDINEAFYDLYTEAVGAPDSLEPVRLVGREIASLFTTAIDERRTARRQRDDLLALRARPRTAARRATASLSARLNPLLMVPNMFDSLLNDIRFALRTLRKSPVFTAVAVATLGLGIGANTAVFSVVNSVLLRPLPYDEPESLFVVWTNFGRDLPQNWLSGPEFLEIEEMNTTFEDFAVFTTSFWSMTADGSDPSRVRGAAVSGDFFQLLRARAAHGRLLDRSDDDQMRRVIVVSDAFWRSQLGGIPDVLGTSITLDGDLFEIVGVLPASFRVHHPNVSNPEGLGVYAAFQPAFGGEYATMSRGSHFLLGFARGRDGVTVEQARADMTAVAARMNETGNYDFEGWGLPLYSLHGDLVENVQGALVVLLGAVAFVLLIACVNVANLQLTRAAQRNREIALRTALGAGRGRLIRQLLTEAAVLAAAGAVAGIGLAYWLIAAIATVVPAGLPRAASIALDGSVLGFAAVATILTVALFGVLPGILATRTNLAETMKDSGRTASAGTSGTRLRGALVVVEVAAALVLLVGAGLLMRSFSSLVNNDPGYRTESRLTMRVALPQTKYDTDTARVFHAQLLDQTRALPGVMAAGAISALPLSNSGGSGTTLAEQSDATDVDEFGGYKYIEADRRYVTDGYFEAMGVEVVAGRVPTAADNADAAPVAVVDESFARRFWGDADPLGQRVSVEFGVNEGELEVNVWREIVGVIRHARTQNLSKDGREQVYVPVAQRPVFAMHLVVRTDAEPTALAGAITGVVWDLDPEQPVSDIATMDERVASAVATPRFNSLLLGSFAAVAMILAAIGIYGVVSFSVGQRTSEIGVRMALGASSTRVRGMVLREGMMVVVIGLGLGVAAALGLTRLITTMLYEVSPTDPLTYLAVAGVLLTVAATACLVPATRATRVEPVAALRDE